MKCRKITALVAILAALSASAGGLSSLTVGGYFDNTSQPAVRVADAGSVEICCSGSWFESGQCTLYVDGEQVATSTGVRESYSLTCPEDSWRSYRLTLRAGDEEITRIVTLYPYAGFSCSLHSLALKNTFIDSRPAGTTRRLRSGDELNIAWSGLWNDAADQSVVTLYRGRGTGGESLGVLVSQNEGCKEGDCPLSARSLPLGQYTLTHFDGVDTLIAYINNVGGGVVILFR